MKVFVATKALTKGIEEVEVTEQENGIAVENINLFPRRFGKKDWFTERKHAVMRAEELREKQIEILKGKIKHLENLKFE